MRVGVAFDRALGVLRWVACSCVAFMMLSITADVVLRRVLEFSPISWVLEVNEYLLLYITFLATAWLLKSEGHTKMDLVLNRLNPGNQARINTIMSMIGAMVCLVISWASGWSTWSTFQSGWYYETTLMTPHWVIHIVIFVGSLLLSIQFIRRTYGYLRGWRASGKEPSLGRKLQAV